MIVLDTPWRARFVDTSTISYSGMKDNLTKALTYIDKRVEFELKKTSDTLKRWGNAGMEAALRNRMGDNVFEAKFEELSVKKAQLTADRKKCLLFEDEAGLWTYSGLAHRLASASHDVVEIAYKAPSSSSLAFSNPPKHKDRPYQEKALESLLEASDKGPCGVELSTGAGKSTVIRNVVKHFGLKSVIMAPSTSIARQLYDDLVYHFGAKRVGLYGDGKKEFDKLIVVGIDDSLTRVAEGTPAWEALSSAKVFVADESHLCPADTLAKVCLGLVKDAPYRFFFSATQLRADGLGLVLDAITGKIVMHKDLKELVDEGYLSRPIFKMVQVRTNSNYSSFDINQMTRKHLYYNRVVIETAADIANKFVSVMKRPVLILVEELEQFQKILPHLKHAVGFAHGPLTAATKSYVPEAHQKQKPKELVEAFNRGEFPILVGTSCISTGTDIQAACAVLYLQGGKSEIKVRQAIGRGTRGGTKGTLRNLLSGDLKEDFILVDFDVVDPDMTDSDLARFAPHRHALERAKIYEEIYPHVENINKMNVL